jgi:hypothetical protein
MNDHKVKPNTREDGFHKIFNQNFGHKKEGEIVGYIEKRVSDWPFLDENGNFIETKKTPIYCKKEWESPE